MLTLRPLTARDGPLLRTLRLGALSDAPTAFGSTYEREAKLTDTQWADKAATWSNGVTGTCRVAIEAGVPVGIAAGYIEADEPGVVWLVSMWVAPAYRRGGLGRRLIEAVEAWAAGTAAEVIKLEVTVGNVAAITLYERCGYRYTGDTQAHPVYPGVTECTMAKPLRQTGPG